MLPFEWHAWVGNTSAVVAQDSSMDRLRISGTSVQGGKRKGYATWLAGILKTTA